MSEILTAGELSALRDRLEMDGKRLVFTNGCFDVLHAGHVRYLQGARELGDALAVGLNGDGSVRALKGEGRPINPEADRAEVLAALRAVDFVTVFEGERCTDLIAEVRPHIYCKGGDYTPESLHPEEAAALAEAGTTIEILPLVPGRSTSSTLAKMGRGEGAEALLKIGVMGSGRGSNLEAILAAIDGGRLDAEVVLVLSDQADARILEVASGRGIEAVHVSAGENPKVFPAAAQKECCDRLVAAGVDVLALAGFLRLVKSPLLETFEGRMLNIHPSLLPKFKGLDAWRQALEAGESETGCTVHQVTADLDAGEIITQAAVPIQEDDTAESLHARIQVEEHRIFPEAIAEVGARVLEVRG